MRSDIVPGKLFPDYEPPDHTRKLRKPSRLQGDDPPILTLARGHYRRNESRFPLFPVTHGLAPPTGFEPVLPP